MRTNRRTLRVAAAGPSFGCRYGSLTNLMRCIFFTERPMRSLACLLVLFSLNTMADAGPPHESNAIEYGAPKRLCELRFDAVKESSGLAVSRIEPDVFWTHNDSGDRPKLYAFDRAGQQIGAFDVAGAKARDWEDMASFEMDGRPYLLIGDVGDNGRKRDECQAYLVAESLPTSSDAKNSLFVEKTVRFQYDRGPQDCESVAFDPTTGQVLLVTKNWSLTADVFLLDWPTGVGEPKRQDEPIKSAALTANFIGKINVPGATAMDISPDGSRAVVLCYGNAYEYVRASDESWKMAFARGAREIKMPERKQGETLCFGHDGRTLFLTSEHLPTPLFCVAPRPATKHSD